MKRAIFLLCIISLASFAQSKDPIDAGYESGTLKKTIFNTKLDSLPLVKFNKELIKEVSLKVINNKFFKKQESYAGTLENAICLTTVCNDDDSGGGGGNAIYEPSISVNTSTICSSTGGGNPTSVILKATGCHGAQKIQWYKNNDVPIGSPTSNFELNITPTSTTTTYFATCVSAVNSNYESRRSNFKTVTRIFTPNAPNATASPSTPILAGHNVNLSATGCSGGAQYYWDNFGFGQSFSGTPLSTSQYKAYCKSSVCTSSPSTINITVLKPIITSSADSICYDNTTQTSNTVTLTLNNCQGSIVWSTNQTTQSIIVNPSISTSYIASCLTPINIYSISNVKWIYTVKAPEITKTTGTNNDFILTAACESGTTIHWSTGATTGSITVPNNQNLEYAVQCKKNNCFSKPSKIKINAAPNISSNINIICQGQALVLTATDCSGTIQWYRASNSSTAFLYVGTGSTHTYSVPTIQFFNALSYKATCTDGSTSPFSNIINIVVTTGIIPSSPIISTIPSSSVINLGNSIQLTATGCGSNTTKWTTGENTATITKTPQSTTTYSAYCLSTCPSALTNETVTVYDINPPTISTVVSNICAGGNLTLNSTSCKGQELLKWYRSPQNNPLAVPVFIGSANPLVVSVNESNIYKATCDKNGATSNFSNELIVNYSNKPTIINGDDSDPIYGAVYENHQLELIASGCAAGDTYVWNTTETAANIYVSPLSETLYTAQCTNASCTTTGTNYFVKVCPTVQNLQSPANDFNTTPFNQPEPASAVYAVNKIQNVGTKIEYQAQESIILNPGFVATKGTVFTAQIGGCKIPSDTNYSTFYIIHENSPLK